jgi:hypothetical protein
MVQLFLVRFSLAVQFDFLVFLPTPGCNHYAPLPIENNVFGYVTFQNNFTNEKMKKFIW